LSLWQDVRTNMRIVTGSRSPQNDARFNLNRFRDNRRVNTVSRPTQRSHCDHTTVKCLLRRHHTSSRRSLAGQSRQFAPANEMFNQGISHCVSMESTENGPRSAAKRDRQCHYTGIASVRKVPRAKSLICPYPPFCVIYHSREAWVGRFPDSPRHQPSRVRLSSAQSNCSQMPTCTDTEIARTRGHGLHVFVMARSFRLSPPHIGCCTHHRTAFDLGREPLPFHVWQDSLKFSSMKCSLSWSF
jgi:hypothetical protein